MTADTSRRGRPKGTGKDDATLLEEIGARLAADPNLKPTTVIKSLGITDDSAVRRLRDKYNQRRAEGISVHSGKLAAARPAAARCLPAARRGGPKLVEAVPVRSATKPAKNKRAKLVGALAPVPATSPVLQSAPPTQAPVTPPVLQSAPPARAPLAVPSNLHTAIAEMLQAQVRIGTAMVRTTPLGMMIHQQIVLANIMMGTIQAQRDLWSSFALRQR